MTEKSIKVQGLRDALKILKAVRNEARETLSSLKKIEEELIVSDEVLMKLKNELSPFSEGDKVLCHWGSSDYDQEGIVIDPYVKYNGYLKLNKEYNENACIVRLNNLKLPSGYTVDQNVVIPWRCIKLANE